MKTRPLVVFVGCLALGACTCRNAPPRLADAGVAKASHGVLTIRAAVEPLGLTRLHDQFVEGTMVRYTNATVYETLGRVSRTDPAGPLEPLLAESWQEAADGQDVTIHLRPRVTFHDGTPFSARDVLAVINVIRNPKNLTTSMRGALDALDRVEMTDELTVHCHFAEPAPFALRTLLGAVPVMPAHALAGPFDTLAIHRAPVGTGPFRFVEWVSGSSLTFRRNPNYWGPAPRLEEVVIRFIQDDAVAMQAWRRGEVGLMTRIAPRDWVSLPWAEWHAHPLLGLDNAYTWLGWNERHPALADPRVRRALALVYPAQQVDRVVDLGLEPRTTCPYWLGSPSCDATVQPWPHDPRAAEALLDDAGWRDSNHDGVRDRQGRPLTFTFLSTARSAKLAKVLPLFQAELRQVGIEAAIEQVDSSQYVARLQQHDFDAALLSWSTPDAVNDAYQVFHSSQADGGSNYVSYSNRDVDDWLTRIRREPNPERRHVLERRVHRQLFEDQVYLFLTARPSLDGALDSVHGLTPSLAWYDLSKAWVDP